MQPVLNHRKQEGWNGDSGEEAGRKVTPPQEEDGATAFEDPPLCMLRSTKYRGYKKKKSKNEKQKSTPENCKKK